MRAQLCVAVSVFAFACGNDSAGNSICDNQVPPPEACKTTCDPSPTAANTCPSGFHCAPDGHCDAQCTQGGNECGDGLICTADGRCEPTPPCSGLECNIVDCAAMGMTDTTIKGTVYAPNGTLPLYGITVYVPNAPVPAMPDGAQCSRCNDDLPGSPIVRAITDVAGNFTILGAPAGQDIPLVITSGKWRRQITIPAVAACTDNALGAAETRLPKNKSEGDIPKIALTTGDVDSLECLIRKLGVDDVEITNSSGTGRVHLYHGDGVGRFVTGWAGGSGEAFSSAETFWNDLNNFKPYDIVIFSCEGGQMQTTKTQASLDALKAYADLGGRVFASHWHNIWIGGYFQGDAQNPDPVIPSWRQVATWSGGRSINTGLIDLIDETNNSKGSSFADWMINVMGSTVRTEIPIENNTGRSTCETVDNTKAERWTYIKGGNNEPQNFQFTTPQEMPLGDRCGKVVFSDMHVSGGPGAGDYPDSCDGGTILPMTPQEKALAFMLFDLASCVGVIF